MNGTLSEMALKSLAISEGMKLKADVLKDASLNFDPRLKQAESVLGAVNEMSFGNRYKLQILKDFLDAKLKQGDSFVELKVRTKITFYLL